ncbi:MAG: hypothetical protein F9K18_09675 [Thermoanaerobaculia bacterium]|nr:MAG: hypothetical protein F9K18_09675 [Thermoanaerobaculia bacterium]
MDGKVEMLRHTLATLAYRGGKAMRGAPAGFGEVRAAPESRSAGEILAHVGDLLDWALALADGEHRWRETPGGAWEEDVRRFHDGLAALDARLASGAPLGCPPERLFQGPVADALTHVGQIALLRRLAAAPVRGENYFKAGIEAGRVGPAQAAPRREFD